MGKKRSYEELMHDPDWVSPAKLVIEKFGGVARLAKLLEIDEASIYRWTYRKGHIPPAQQYRILQLAEEFRVVLTPRQLICGKE